MGRSFLESALIGTVPSFAAEWDARRRTYAPEAQPSASEFIAALRSFVVRFLDDGRVAETTRLFYAVERLLGEADPILQELLEGELIAGLAADCRAAGVDSRRITPYLGPRSRRAWEARENP